MLSLVVSKVTSLLYQVNYVIQQEGIFSVVLLETIMISRGNSLLNGCHLSSQTTRLF